MTRGDRLSDPLRPLLSLRRNPRRWVPQALIVGLVSGLILCVVTPTNTFRRTGRANLSALDAFTAVSPRLSSSFDPLLLWLLDENPHQARRLPARVLWIRYPMLIGDTFCPLVLLPAEEQPAFLGRLGLRLARGRLPRPGEDGVALQADVARGRRLDIGQAFGTAVDPEETTPGRFTVVGILEGAARLGIGDIGQPAPPGLIAAASGEFQLVVARGGERDSSDAYLKRLAGQTGPLLQVVDRAWGVHRTERALRNLPLLVDFLTLATATVVALVIALLHVIAFQSRADEFGILLVTGRRRGELLRLLAGESVLLAGAAWFAGAALAIVALGLYQHFVLTPRGMLMGLVEPRAWLLSLIVPVAATAASVTALGHRLARLDPLAIVQRRAL